MNNHPHHHPHQHHLMTPQSQQHDGLAVPPPGPSRQVTESEELEPENQGQAITSSSTNTATNQCEASAVSNNAIDNSSEKSSPMRRVSHHEVTTAGKHKSGQDTNAGTSTITGTTSRTRLPADFQQQQQQQQNFRASPGPYHHIYDRPRGNYYLQSFGPRGPFPAVGPAASSFGSTSPTTNCCSSTDKTQQLQPANTNNNPLEALPSANASLRAIGCTCKKSRCLKLYCQCFASSTTCGPTCKCQVCHNTTLHGEDIDQARKAILERNPSAFDDKFRAPALAPPAATARTSSNGWQVMQQPRHAGMAPPHSSPPRLTGHLFLNQPSIHPTNFGVHPHNRHNPHRHHPMMSPTNGWTGPYALAAANRVSPPQNASVNHQSMASSPPVMPAPRVNKYGCKCRRSFCLKKYCECYQHSVRCGLNCRCTNCKNIPDAGGPGSGDEHPNVPSASATEYKEAVAQEENMSRRVSFDYANYNNQYNYHLEQAALYGLYNNHCSQEEKKEDDGDTPGDMAGKEKNNTDRMAIMAAVAMTELLGGSDDNYKSGASSSETTGEANIVSAETSPHRRRGSEGEHPEATVLKKTKLDDPEGDAGPVVISMSSSSTMDSSYPRMPSPRSSHMYCLQPLPPVHGRFSYLPGTPTGGANQRFLPMAHHRNLTPPHQFHRHHHLAMSPPTKITPPFSHNNSGNHLKDQAPPPARASPTYEDVIRSSGLPKSLSFRKICSKCGKTRGEHGELGFGNKCVYQDCGKCGAGVQMHLRAGVPMGILCTLSVDDGATPGASGAYDRKIRELASRAELQKELQKRKQEAAARAVAAGAP